MKNLDELIQTKIKELDDLIKEMNKSKKRLDELNIQTLRLDGAISQLKELKGLDIKE